MDVRFVETVAATDSANRPVDAIPVREWEEGMVDASGRPADPADVTETDDGIPVRAVIGSTAANSAGMLIDTLVVRGGGGDPGPTPGSGVAAFVGHSLVSNDMAPMFEQYGDVEAVHQVIIGASLSLNWSDHEEPSVNGISVRNYLGANAVDYLILAQAGPIENYNGFTRDIIQTWRDAGLAQNPDMKTIWYQIWPAIVDWATTPDWALWVSEIDRLAEEVYNVTAQQIASDIDPVKVYISPVGEVFARLYEAFLLGDLTGVSNFKTTFFPLDEIHQPAIGMYVATLTHYATAYGVSPVGLPWDLTPDVTDLTETLAAEIQAIVWDVVSNHPYAGVATWPPLATPGTIGTPVHTGISAGGTGVVTASVDLGAARAGRIGATLFMGQVDTGITSVGYDIGGPNESLFTKVAEIVSGRTDELWVGEIDPALAGTQTMTITVGSGDRWASNMVTAVMDGVTTVGAIYQTSETAAIDMLAEAGDVIFGGASVGNNQPTVGAVLDPDDAGVLSAKGTDDGTANGWGLAYVYGVAGSAINSLFRKDPAANCPKISAVFPTI